MCKAKKGGLKDTSSDALLYGMLRAVQERSGVDPALVEDITVGVCHTPSPTYEARAAALAAGFPQHVPVQAVNRLCSSGLMAVRSISDSIARGDIQVGLAVGYESMTSQYVAFLFPIQHLLYSRCSCSSNSPRPTPAFGHPDVQANQLSQDCAQPMGWTSENVATDFGIERQAMDEYALLSHTRAAAAQESGRFNDEIVPFPTIQIDATDPSSTKQVVLTKDDGIRPGSTIEALAKLRPAFPQWGEAKTTAGNSSPVTDGAAAVMLMTRRKAEELGVPILARHVTTVVTGVAPRHMGVGPVYAIP